MTGEEILKFYIKNETAIKENLLKSEVIEDIKKKTVDFLDKTLNKESLLYLRFEKQKTNKNIKTFWSNEDGYPFSNSESFLSPWVNILKEHMESKTIKERWENENYFVETRKQGKDSDIHIIVGKKDDNGKKSHSVVDAKTGEIRVEDGQIDSSEILPVLETYLKFPDGRTIVSRRGKLEELTPVPSETGPIIDIEGSFIVSGGSEGQTVGFQAKNIGNSPAVDIVCWFVSDEGNIARIEGIAHRLSPDEKSMVSNFTYSHTLISEREFPGLKILFEFKDIKGNILKTGRLVKQDSRADGKYNIHSYPGEFVIVK
jgi:hypothetical protein